jgi:pilus assembly protein Flp/PilA
MQTLSQMLYSRLVTSLVRDEEGQTMAEYGVVLALITLGVVGVLTALGVAVTGKLGEVVTALGGALPKP